MVRKVSKLFVCLLAAAVTVSAATQAAAAASVYQGTVSTTYVDYAKQILTKCSPFYDYVFFRSGQYEYTLVCGEDLTLNVDTFVGFNLEAFTITYHTSTSGYGGTSYYTVTGETIASFNLDTNNELVYSSLGSFPTLTERGDFVETLTLLLLVIVALCMLIRPVYDFVLRRRDCS